MWHLWEEVELENVAENLQIKRRQPSRDEDSVYFSVVKPAELVVFSIFFSCRATEVSLFRVYRGGIYFLNLHHIQYWFKFPAVDKYANTKQDLSPFIYLCMLILFLCVFADQYWWV